MLTKNDLAADGRLRASITNLFPHNPSERPISNEDQFETFERLLQRFASPAGCDLMFVCPSCKVRREIHLDRTQMETRVALWCVYCKQTWDLKKQNVRVTVREH
jgi:hypothetical protein